MRPFTLALMLFVLLAHTAFAAPKNTMPPGEVCPATMRLLKKSSVAYAEECNCGGREAHFLMPPSNEEKGEMKYVPGSEHKEKRKSPPRMIPLSAFMKKGKAAGKVKKEEGEGDL